MLQSMPRRSLGRPRQSASKSPEERRQRIPATCSQPFSITTTTKLLRRADCAAAGGRIDWRATSNSGQVNVRWEKLPPVLWPLNDLRGKQCVEQFVGYRRFSHSLGAVVWSTPGKATV